MSPSEAYTLHQLASAGLLVGLGLLCTAIAYRITFRR